MNKVILIGRLTRDPEIRYSQAAEPMAIARYGLVVDRRFKRQGEPDADFFDCVVFGKGAEFAEKYLKKGMRMAVTGSLRNDNWEDKQTGQKRYRTEIVLDEQEFCESKASNDSLRGGEAPPRQSAPAPKPAKPQEFFAIEETLDDEDLPF